MNGKRQLLKEKSTRSDEKRKVGAEKPKPEESRKKVLLSQHKPELGTLTSSHSALSQHW